MSLETRPDAIRQMAGLRMKVSLDSADEVLALERKSRWSGLAAHERGAIKDLVTRTLLSQSVSAGRVAAQVIAKIGAIEIQPDANSWPELLPGLFSIVENQSLGVAPRAAALTTLGYLLEELDVYDESPLEQAEVDRFLTVVHSAMAVGSPQPVQLAAVKAMLNALPFVATNFEDSHAQERNSIMAAICAASQLPCTLDVREVSFECITKVAELYYDHLDPYMATLAPLTFAAAAGQEEVRSQYICVMLNGKERG